MCRGYYVQWSDEDAQFVGRSHDFPSLSYLADDQLEALDGIQKLVEDDYLEIHAERRIDILDYTKHEVYRK